MSETTSKDIFIKARDGYVLAGTHWKNTNPKGIITFNAGTCVKRGFYKKMGTWLHQQNYDVLSYDYRGVGDSRPETLKDFDASIVTWAQQDITGVIDWMTEKYPTQKKYIIAHSMGGQVIGLSDNINELDKMIAFAPSYGNWQNYTAPEKYKTGFYWATLFPYSAWKYGYFPAEKFNLGEDWPKGVTWDWWSWGIRRIPHSQIMDNKKIPHFYKSTTVPIKAYFMVDDNLATARTIPHYKYDFSNTQLEIEILKPIDFGVKKIGHMGMFSTKCEGIWQKVLQDLEAT